MGGGFEVQHHLVTLPGRPPTGMGGPRVDQGEEGIGPGDLFTVGFVLRGLPQLVALGPQGGFDHRPLITGQAHRQGPGAVIVVAEPHPAFLLHRARVSYLVGVRRWGGPGVAPQQVPQLGHRQPPASSATSASAWVGMIRVITAT